MSKAPKSGPGVAPVLPAMGVYSYHNDRRVCENECDASKVLIILPFSPPFSGATELLGEPDPLSLSISPGNMRNGESGHQTPATGGAYATPHFVSKHLARGITPPGAEITNEGQAPERNELGLSDTLSSQLAQIRLDPASARSATSLQSNSTGSTINPVRPDNPRVPTSEDDISLSSMRSRRLLSGYLFGNPPTPDDSARAKEQGIPADGAASPLTAKYNLDLSADIPQPPSTPSTVVSGHEEEIEAARLSPSTGEEPIENDDALMGFQDGEADADERARAVQAEHGGSQGYMRKEEGEAGEYRFPTHRLKRHMKGES